MIKIVFCTTVPPAELLYFSSCNGSYRTVYFQLFSDTGQFSCTLSLTTILPIFYTVLKSISTTSVKNEFVLKIYRYFRHLFVWSKFGLANVRPYQLRYGDHILQMTIIYIYIYIYIYTLSVYAEKLYLKKSNVCCGI